MAGKQLFKLVETDLMSKELTRYGPSDADHLGLFSIKDVLADIVAASAPLPRAEDDPSRAVTEDSVHMPSPTESVAATVIEKEKVLAAWGLGVTDALESQREEVRETPAEEEAAAEKMAIKRTYQPSTLKRKRKHGFLSRVKTRLGKKILGRRQQKGRRRLGI